MMFDMGFFCAAAGERTRETVTFICRHEAIHAASYNTKTQISPMLQLEGRQD